MNHFQQSAKWVKTPIYEDGYMRCILDLDAEILNCRNLDRETTICIFSRKAEDCEKFFLMISTMGASHSK